MNNIVFIGMMGTFKSAVAKQVAATLRRPLVDTDAVFERRFMKIDDYFARCGEAKFRIEEKKIVAESARRKNAVISCGGGVVLDEENMRLLSESGTVVLLTASEEAIIERVGRAQTRPLLKGEVAANVRRISAERKELYEKYADLTVDNTVLSADACAQEVLRLLENNK